MIVAFLIEFGTPNLRSVLGNRDRSESCAIWYTKMIANAASLTQFGKPYLRSVLGTKIGLSHVLCTMMIAASFIEFL